MRNMKTKWLALFLVATLAIQMPAAVSAAEISEKNQTVVMESESASVTDSEFLVEKNMKYANTNELTFPTKIKIHTGSGMKHSWLYFIGNMPSNGKVTNLSISNKKIATVKADSTGIHITPKKVGNATIKFTVKYGSKKKNFTSKLTVYKYVNPVSSYKFGGKEIKSKFDKSTMYNYTLKKNRTVKFSVKAKTGWKITSFTYYDNKGKSHRYTTNSPQITLKKGGGSIQINFSNQKTGVIENIVIWIG